MFRCAITNTLSEPREGAMRLVTHIRQRTYIRKNFKTDQDDMVGHGWEIVREVLVRRGAYEELMAQGFKPEVVKDRGQR
jgi:hypothetical protein